MAMYEISIKIVFPYCMFYNMVLMPLPTGREPKESTFHIGNINPSVLFWEVKGKVKRLY